jgi:site-specific DNA-methyltransferase (adenine-specific)
MEYLIRIYSPVNTTVLDPFCGSGTTGIAAITQNRSFVGIDLSEHYTQITSMRIADAIDKQP